MNAKEGALKVQNEKFEAAQRLERETAPRQIKKRGAKKKALTYAGLEPAIS